MAKKIKKLPNHAFVGMLKFLNMLIALVFGIFCFVTGQTPKAPAGSSFTGSSSADTIVITPDYGIIPMYGVITIEYGVMYAEYTVSGKISSTVEEEPIEGIKVTIRDTLQNLVVDSAVSDAKGEYNLNFSQLVRVETWLLRVEDIDGAENGSYSSKDSLITIPLAADPDGVIRGEAAIDMFLLNHASGLESAKSGQLSLDLRQDKTYAVELRYTLPDPSNVVLAVYNSQGSLKQVLIEEYKQAGEHSLTWNAQGLARGAYYFKLTAGKQVLVKKGQLGR